MSNSAKSTTGELINFRDFDAVILEVLERKVSMAHTLINEVDKPVVVDSLREYLIRNVGCFEIVGFYRPSDLSIWYERDAIVEEFDELLLKFRDYIIFRGYDVKGDYILTRYKDNLHFVLEERVGSPVPIEMIGVVSDPEEERFKEVNEEFKGCIWAWEDRIQDRCNHNLDVDAFLKELLENNPYMDGLIRKHMVPLEDN